MRTYLISLICTGLLLLVAGCPSTRHQEPAKATTQTSASSELNTTDAATAAATPPQSTDPAAAQGAAANGDVPAATTTTGEPPAAPVTAVQITGTWLALFGRSDQGVNEEATTATGHQLQFSPDGTLLLTLLKDGKPGKQLPGSYIIDGDRLEWSYSLIETANAGAFEIAPLGMGRDEEIGLLRGDKDGMGRDEEIGLDQGKRDGSPQQQLHTEDLRIVLDGPFMALTDDHGQIYVYGNKASESQQPLPEHAWTGTLGGKAVTVQFATQDGQVTGQFGEYGGSFTGKLASGFITGRVEGRSRLSLAALALDREGKLCGVLLPDPYAKMDPQFDFSPVQ
jgi:hypothetical protein